MQSNLPFRQLGSFSRAEVLDLDPATGDFSGTVTFIAANGDRLDCDITGQFISAVDAQGGYTITGGTDGIAFASGQATFDASLIGPTTFRLSFVGEIVR